jgi:CRISPR/Cas system-associated exonuclease Cas4 (RecB family)
MTRAKDKLILVGARPDRAESRRIGRIVNALGLKRFPETGEAIGLDDIDAAIIGVVGPAEGEEARTRGEERAGICGPFQAPEPLCFLQLQPPSLISRQISFSALSAFGRCPRRFYLERVLGLGSAPLRAHANGEGETSDREEAVLDEVETSAGRDVGLLVHALLEQADLTGLRPPRDDLLEEAATTAARADLPVSAAGIERAARLASAFWDSPLAGVAEIGSALREEPFFFPQGAMTVHGVMDLLCRGEQGWLIADYKSNALAGRTPAEIAESYHMQAAVYCLAALKAGAPAVRMEFLFLEKPDEPVVLEYRQEDRERLEDLLDEALSQIRESTFPLCAGPACGDCEVAGFCRR